MGDRGSSDLKRSQPRFSSTDPKSFLLPSWPNQPTKRQLRRPTRRQANSLPLTPAVMKASLIFAHATALGKTLCGYVASCLFGGVFRDLGPVRVSLSSRVVATGHAPLGNTVPCLSNICESRCWSLASVEGPSGNGMASVCSVVPSDLLHQSGFG